MNRRCVRCKFDSFESSFKYHQRTFKDMDAPYFCRTCFKKQDIPIDPKEENQIFEPILEIEDFQITCKPLVEQANEIRRARTRKYLSTEKGKESQKKGHITRTQRLHHAKRKTSSEELEEIRLFYKNTPEGYVVDHIKPLSKGGLHQLSNLQYLTPDQNLHKSTKNIRKVNLNIKINPPTNI